MTAGGGGGVADRRDGGVPVWRSGSRGSAAEPVSGSRREAEVRSLLDLPHPPAPPDLAERAMRRGTRLLRLRRARGIVLCLALLAAVAALAVAATVAVQHERPPVTPSIYRG